VGLGVFRRDLLGHTLLELGEHGLHVDHLVVAGGDVGFGQLPSQLLSDVEAGVGAGVPGLLGGPRTLRQLRFVAR